MRPTSRLTRRDIWRGSCRPTCRATSRAITVTGCDLTQAWEVRHPVSRVRRWHSGSTRRKVPPMPKTRRRLIATTVVAAAASVVAVVRKRRLDAASQAFRRRYGDA